MSRKKEFKTWQDRVRMSQDYKKKVVDPKMIQRFHDYFKGKFYEDKIGTDRIAVNTVFPNVKILQAALALNSPTFKVIADDPSKKSRENIIESLLDNTFYRMTFTRTLKKCVRDAHLNWGGVCASGYNFKLAKDALGKEIENVDPKTKDPKEYSEVQIYHEYIKEDSVYAVRRSPNLFFIDPDATENLVDAKWCFETIIQSAEYIEDKFGVDNESIPNKVAEWLIDIMKNVGLANDKEVRKGTIYQIYDLESAKRIVMIEGHEKLFEYDWNYEFYPYSTLVFNENPDESYGTPDVKIYEPQQLELNKVRTLQMNTINRNNPRWQVVRNGMDTDEIEKFIKNELASIVTVNAPNAITPIPPIQIDPSLFNYEPRIKADIQEGQGIDDIMRGGENATRKSATESAVRDFYSKLRIGERKEAVDEFVTDIAIKLLGIMQKEYTIPRFISVVGANAQYLADNAVKTNEQNQMNVNMAGGSKQFTGQFSVQGGEVGNITGKYQLYIRTSSYAQNKALDANRLQTFLPFLAINPMVNPKELTELVVDIGLDGFDTSKLIVPDAYEISTDPMKAELFRQMMAGGMLGKGGAGQAGARNPGEGEAGPGMTNAKMGSEQIQQGVQ